MNLQPTLDQRVWQAVSDSYESANYSRAISDSFIFLSDLIRNKSGLDSDGAPLIGSAFGGDSPVIKINSFQTETERSEQKGIEQVLRGLYLGFRNPRSHEKREDTQETADALIGFISFLVGLIDRSKSPFDIEQIIQQVFDKHFVPTSEYAVALASRIPVRKMFDVLVEVFNRRLTAKTESVTIFCCSVVATLSEDSQTAFWEVVSAALEEATSDVEFRTAVSIAGKSWPKLSNVARLRTENRLIASIREGEYDVSTGSCSKGALGTWASGVTSDFLSQKPLREALTRRLEAGQPAVDYVLRYFKSAILVPAEPLEWDLECALSYRLSSDDQAIFDALWFVGSSTCHESWAEELKDPMDQFRARNQITDEDIPF